MPAACCVIALRETIGDAPAIRLAHRVLKAVWEQERNPGDPATLASLIAEERRTADTEAALARG
ncbi:MAG TPA: hypothetical protein VLI93_15480 [Acetobacteraceae bacterium]|nr:hypothetical protein [Acetobacteraceae bacterium]